MYVQQTRHAQGTKRILHQYFYFINPEESFLSEEPFIPDSQS